MILQGCQNDGENIGDGSANGQILVLSDSHGDIETMIDIIAFWEDSVDVVLFMGDGAEEFLEVAYMFEALQFFAVTGNNDRAIAPNSRVNFPLEQQLTIFDHHLYLTHGHIASYPLVKDEVLTRAKKADASIVLYGHLHLPEVYIEENIARFNPGSIAFPRGNFAPSYLLLTIGQDYLEYQFFNAKSHQKIEIAR